MKSKHRNAATGPVIDKFREQHIEIVEAQISGELGPGNVLINEAESPLAWLARRRGRNGISLIEPHQFQAGERLRVEFTCANLMPRTTSNWNNQIPGRRSGTNSTAEFTDLMIASRQRLNKALEAVGPEFAGLLVDVCCFLKGLEEVERERSWPARSAKVVLQLALNRLARHYGYATKTQGYASVSLRAWHACAGEPGPTV